MKFNPFKNPSCGPSADEVDNYFKAARNADRKALEKFLSQYPGELDVKDSRWPATALEEAVRGGDLPTVEFLLDKGADTKNLHKLIIVASVNAHHSVLQFLVDWPEIEKKRIEELEQQKRDLVQSEKKREEQELAADIADFTARLKRPLPAPRRLQPIRRH